MTIAQIQVEVDEAKVKEILNEKLDAIIEHELVYWDVEHMTKRLCMSKSFLENEIIPDPRMRLLERRKERGKRYWPYKESVRVIQAILDEW